MPNAVPPEDNALVGKYEIAQPQSYETFSAPVAPAHISAHEVSTKPERGPYGEAWDDTGKAMPWDATADTRKSVVEARRATTDGRRETRAIWIVHGMGQQIPFETVDSLTQGLLSVGRPPRVIPRLRTVRLGEQTIQRVELDLDGMESDADGKPKRQYELHLYESYWAPLTEGVAGLQDVVSFLLDGGFRGLLNFVQKFSRAMFGGMQAFRISIRTPLAILATLLVLLALTIINGVILLAAAATTKSPALAPLQLDSSWPQLTALASWMTVVVFTFGTILFLADLSKPNGVPRAVRVTISTLVWLALVDAVIMIVGTAVVMAGAMHKIYIPDWFSDPPRAQLQAIVTLIALGCGILIAMALLRRANLRSAERRLRSDWMLLFLFALAFCVHVASLAVPIWLLSGEGFTLPSSIRVRIICSTIWVWPLLIVLSAQIRKILVEYVGDVAIYITPNKLDRFSDVRNEIKALASSVASAIYLACRPGTKSFLYDEVAVVGHSLGSVIAYDTLNGLMLSDWLSNNHLGIANRTNSLVTFGSPLDKTAFLFTIQATNSLHIRERLAATVQPIIQSYAKFRKFRWINVYSRNDIISGKLTFYDLPRMQNPQEIPPQAVHNVVDKDASIPLIAHVDYWKNPTTWMELLQQIVP
ncbi:MAG: hypothetical protein WA193_01605 [Candidatus Acidiferrales bacterium]